MTDAVVRDRARAAMLDTLAQTAGAQLGAENFPVALRVLPARVRVELTAFYAFARFVDDIGDEAPGGPDERLALLDLVAADVRRLAGPAAAHRHRPDAAAGRGAGPDRLAARVAVRTLLDLVEANRVDQRVTSYETFADLMGYCRLSAAPVGRVVLHLAGAATERNVADSDSVCAALQVLEHCQDVGEDAHAGRVYLPAAELRADGVDPAELRDGSTTPGVRRVVGRQVEQARLLLLPGRSLVRRLRGWARVAVAGYVAGGAGDRHRARPRPGTTCSAAPSGPRSHGRRSTRRGWSEDAGDRRPQRLRPSASGSPASRRATSTGASGCCPSRSGTRCARSTRWPADRRHRRRDAARRREAVAARRSPRRHSRSPAAPRRPGADGAGRRRRPPADPLAAFGELIDGCEQDVTGRTYTDLDDLVGYCRFVAGSIGRLSLACSARRWTRPTPPAPPSWPTRSASRCS